MVSSKNVWISSIKFGSITIDGRVYENDVILTWDGKVKAAETETRHLIGTKELSQLILERPEIIVIGTGQTSLVRISPEVVKLADEKKLKIIEKPTPAAVKEFSELAHLGKKVVAYLHLTC
jgi:hypothetical protein